MSPEREMTTRINNKAKQHGKIKVGTKTNRNKPTVKDKKGRLVKAQPGIKTQSVADIIEIPEFPELKIKVVRRGNDPSLTSLFTSYMFNNHLDFYFGWMSLFQFKILSRQISIHL